MTGVGEGGGGDGGGLLGASPWSIDLIGVGGMRTLVCGIYQSKPHFYVVLLLDSILINVFTYNIHVQLQSKGCLVDKHFR